MNWKGANSSVLNFKLRQWHTGHTFKKKSIKLYKTKIYSTPKMKIINKTQYEWSLYAKQFELN